MYQLGQATAHGRALLQAVAREAVGKHQVVAGRVHADQGVVVEGVHLVVARPGALQTQGLKRRNACGQRGPDMVVKGFVGGLQRRKVGVLVGGRRKSGDETPALGAQPDAAGVDEQGAARQLRRAGNMEHRAPLAHHRQRDARPRGNRCRPGAARVHCKTAGQGAAAAQPHRLHVLHTVAAGQVQAHGLVGQVTHALALRLFAQGRQQHIAIKPAFARQTQRAQRHVLQRQPGKLLLQLRRAEQRHIGTQLPLQYMVVLQRGRARRRGQVQVAALVQADVGCVPVAGQQRARVA